MNFHPNELVRRSGKTEKNAGKRCRSGNQQRRITSSTCTVATPISVANVYFPSEKPGPDRIDFVTIFHFFFCGSPWIFCRYIVKRLELNVRPNSELRLVPPSFKNPPMHCRMSASNEYESMITFQMPPSTWHAVQSHRRRWWIAVYARE